MKGETLKAFVCALSIAAIVLLEALALSQGVNGTGLGVSTGAIGAIGGYWARKARRE